MENVQVRMPDELIKKINKLAEDKLSTPSQVIREATLKGLPLMK